MRAVRVTSPPSSDTKKDALTSSLRTNLPCHRLLPVDNSKGEVIKNRAAAEPELFTNTAVNMHKSQWPRASRCNIGECSKLIHQ